MPIALPETTNIPDTLVVVAIQLLVCLHGTSLDKGSTGEESIAKTRPPTLPLSRCKMLHYATQLVITQSTLSAFHAGIKKTPQGRPMGKRWNK